MLGHSAHCCHLGEGTLQWPRSCVFLTHQVKPPPGPRLGGNFSIFAGCPSPHSFTLFSVGAWLISEDYLHIFQLISCRCRQFGCPCSLTAIFKLLVFCSDRFRLFLQITGGKLWLEEWVCNGGGNVRGGLLDFASPWLDLRATCNPRAGFWEPVSPLLACKPIKRKKRGNSFHVTSSLSIST